MSTVITGLPTTITSRLAATVNDATNATPIVIGTTAAHLYATGDRVAITGVTGNTAANSGASPWVITVIDATHFSLTGSVGSGAYVAGGTCSNYSLTPQFTIPSDGDAFTAAAFNVAYQALADRTQYLQKRIDGTATTVTRNVPFGTARALNVSVAVAQSGVYPGPYDILPGAGCTIATGYMEFTDSVLAYARHTSIPLDQDLPHGATIVSATLNLKGPGGHGAIPFLPILSLVRYTANGEVIQELLSTGMVTDPSLLAAYEAYHSFTYTCDQYNVVDRNAYTYAAIVSNEAGATALAGLRLYSLTLTLSVPNTIA